MKRLGCPPKTQVRILKHQRYKCLYCRRLFGSVYYINGRMTIISVQWDHIVPYSYLRANPENNWAASCQLCNYIKSDRIFAYMYLAKEFIQDRIEKRYSILEAFVPSVSNEQDPETWSREFARYITYRDDLGLRRKEGE